MPAVDEIADYLATQSEGTVGTDLFTHHLPASPDAAVAVRQFAGTRSTWAMTRTIAENVMLRIECRATSRQAAETKCYSIFKKLDRLANTTVGGVLYYLIRGTRPPGPLMTAQHTERTAADQTANRFTWYCEFEIQKAVTP